MKIFNWVHRRFRHKDGFGRNVKKVEFAGNDHHSDREELLEHAILADMLDGWRDGILAIGTFGLDPLKDFNQKVLEGEEEEYCDDDAEYLGDDDEDMGGEEEGELNPLVFTSFRHGFDMDKCSDLDEHAPKSDPIMTIHGTPLCPTADLLGLHYGEKKRRGERITLADLFWADSDANTKPCQPKAHPDHAKKQTLAAKNGLSFAKKLIPRAGEDSRPMRKIHKMMTKMLKRKIHPDMEGKFQSDAQIKPNVLGLGHDKYGANNESVSLLQTQGSTYEL